MHPARRALIPLLVALTALVAQAGAGAAAPSLPAPARVCVAPAAAWQPGMDATAGAREARFLSRDETDAQTDDVMIVVELIFGGVY